MVPAKIERILKRAFDIRQGEASRTILMFCYAFLIISSLMIVKPVSTALFLSKLGASKLPIVFILVAILAAAISTHYSRLLKKVPLNRIMVDTVELAILSLLILWSFLHFHYLQGWVLYVFYVWVAIFAVITNSQFWILANQLFNAREAKRLFGFIGAGAITGGIFGGYLTNFLAPILGSENMLLVCGGLLFLCIPITRTVWRHHIARANEEGSSDDVAGDEVPDHPLTLLRNHRHLLFMASIVGISVVVAKLVEYQFSAIASAQITHQDQLTAFLGFWLSNLNVASLMIQLFLTRRVVGFFGVGVSLLFLPAGILVGAVAILVSPALWSAVLIKISDGSLKQSINKAGMELLALPLPSEIKNQAKSFLDVFVDSFATGAGGLLLILLTHGLGFSVRQLSGVSILLLAIWMYLVTRARHAYVESFRAKIEGQKSPSAAPAWDAKNKSVIDGFIRVLQGDHADQILQVLKMVKDVQNSRLLPCFKKLLRHPSNIVRLEVLRNIYFYEDGDFVHEVKELVNDKDLEIKTEAIRYLYQHAPDEWQTELLEVYLQHEDYQIRGAALLCAARESRNNDDLKYIFRVKERVEQALKRLHHGSDEARTRFTKINCARVIGIANIPELYPHLHLLLKDADAEIRKSAVVSAGQSGNKEFIPILCRHLLDGDMYATARQALMGFGLGIIDILAHIINDSHEHKDIRLSLPKVIATMGIQKSVDVLVQSLGQQDLDLRREIIKALNRLRDGSPTLYFHEYTVAARVIDEAKEYLKTLAATLAEPASGATPSPDAASPTPEEIEQGLGAGLERIFRLLGLIYPPEDIYNAYRRICSGVPESQVNAVEFLDNVLETNLKRLIIPIVESTMVGPLRGNRSTGTVNTFQHEGVMTTKPSRTP